VRPGYLPAKVIVAPNSPSARVQHSTAPATIPGATSGSVTRRNTVHRDAPRVTAASSNRRSMPPRAPATPTPRNGIATNASASTTAGVENGRVIPNQASRYRPSTPRRPSASSSATPPTTGGSTSGTVTSARSTRTPGSSDRASTQASGTPASRQAPVASVADSPDSRSAASTVRLVSCSGSACHGARSSSAASGSTRNASPAAAGSHSTAGSPGPRRL